MDSHPPKTGSYKIKMSVPFWKNESYIFLCDRAVDLYFPVMADF